MAHTMASVSLRSCHSTRGIKATTPVVEHTIINRGAIHLIITRRIKMCVAETCAELRTSVCARRVNSTSTVGSQTVVNRQAVILIVTWRKIVSIAETRVRLRSSVCTS